MTADSVPLRLIRPVSWLHSSRAVWLQRRVALLGLLGVTLACAIPLVLEGHNVNVSLDHYLAVGCASTPGHSPCLSISRAINGKSDLLSSLVVALYAFPIIVGVFVGAPVISRELESGTCRFTWTQGVGRTRSLIVTLAVFAGVVALLSGGLGALLGWFAHPFEVVGVQSRWQASLFDTTWLVLPGWSLVGLALGALLGAVIARVVATMAISAIVLTGLLAVAFAELVDHLLSLGVAVSHPGREAGGFLAAGTLNQPAQVGQGVPSGSWLVQGWLTGPHGRRLTPAATTRVFERLALAFRSAQSGVPAHSPVNWLSLHGYLYQLAYQPPGRYWVFQLIATAGLVVAAALLAAGAVLLVRRRSV